VVIVVEFSPGSRARQDDGVTYLADPALRDRPVPPERAERLMLPAISLDGGFPVGRLPV
jgi:hypothetical protein